MNSSTTKENYIINDNLAPHIHISLRVTIPNISERNKKTAGTRSNNRLTNGVGKL